MALHAHMNRPGVFKSVTAAGYQGFRTVYDKEAMVWRGYYVPATSPATEWAKDKEFVAWVECAYINGHGDETTLSRNEDTPEGTLRGVIVVSITKEEMADEDVPPEFIVEYQNEELVRPMPEPSRRRGQGAEKPPKQRQTKPDGTPRAKSEVASPVRIVWETCEAMSNASRKEIIAECIAKGVNPATAATQYSRWRREQAPKGE